jgi:hypothetical protein
MLKQPLTMHGVRKKLRLFSKENAQPCIDQPTIYDTEDIFTIYSGFRSPICKTATNTAHEPML